MNYRLLSYLVLMVVLLLNPVLFAINEVTVRVPDIYLSKPGYIDKSLLVIEPHGGYSEQSLYLQYSDHGQFSRGQKVEIIHRFELPQGAVVNDMWLWIGDSVMKAICLDTWTARSIYDSIVSMKRDPAFLSKKGNQYELHIYPLEPGSFRKIKLNFIVPNRYIGQNTMVELPLAMLKSNNNKIKPLDLLFRTREDRWGVPTFYETDRYGFNDISDTADYHYRGTYIDDISQYASLKLKYSVEMKDGIYFDSNISYDQTTFFQSVLQLKDVFNIGIDSISQKNIIAMDLSGNYNKNYQSLIPNLKSLFKASLKPNDYFNVIVSGAGNTKKLSGSWIPASQNNIETLLDGFSHSTFADSISSSRTPGLIYADPRAAICWNFTGIEQMTDISKYNELFQAAGSFKNADIIASYDQGNEHIPSSDELPVILKSLDDFFAKGGRFITYFDFNRDSRHEPVATHYIHGLGTKLQLHDAVTLYRNTNGNIGRDFQESIIHAGTYFLKYDDQDVKVELTDKEGNPAVISKRVGNGLLVVSGIWSFNDDAPLRKILGIPLLGLNHSKSPALIGQTLNALNTEYKKEAFDKILFISNSDSLVLQQEAVNRAADYAASFGTSAPVFNSLNLLDGTIGVPASISSDNITYYGSGYLLKKIADSMNGIHIESHLNDWNMISSMLSPYSIPPLEQLTVEAYADNSPEKIPELRQIIQQPQDNNSPRFFIGSASVSSGIKFNIKAKFSGIASALERSFSLKVVYDPARLNSILPAMLGNEQINELMSAKPQDTTKIVQLAVKYNLLCDYTSLLALEPDSKIHFMKDPLDESGLTDISQEEKQDSLQLSVFPNPFNSQTRILVKVKSPSSINLNVYNVLGQLVNTIALNEEIPDSKTYYWNASDVYNQSVSSGVYIARLEIKEHISNSVRIFTRKLLLVK